MRKILIAEDELAINKMLCMNLELMGYETVAKYDGQQVIDWLNQGGSADLAGLQTGDRIVSVDGTEITSADEVRAALNEHSTGDQMNMVIERNGDTIEVRVSL